MVQISSVDAGANTWQRGKKNAPKEALWFCCEMVPLFAFLRLFKYLGKDFLVYFG